ncbi:hypothetical protein VO63_00375 [Streptomyces showdoensis]|uniref:DUF2812 domain-containing protein n=1 Tax=Streptomyces showdoensis TaxID=68268 RepID=A0A2P2GWG6_STREW|nr:hypothetical protein VO63_00375 [Streptomyces showdoensis]
MRAAGVPEEQIARTADELRGHLAESGTTAEEEFGPADRFAASLGGLAPAPGEPDEAAERWTWTADLFNDRRMLAVHGDQGWEVEHLDSLGRFVCRRAPGAPLAWEYRREIIAGRRRAKVLGELDPEGWELCGEWLVYGYLKRPKAATAGPAGTLGAVPAAPDRRLFLSRRAKALLAVWAAATGAAYLSLGLPGLAMLIALGGALSAVYTAKLETDRGKVAAKNAADRESAVG